MTVSDDLVERVAAAMANGKRVTFHERAYARAAIAALSTPEFVLPLAEEMLRAERVRRIAIIGSTVSVSGVKQQPPGGQQVSPVESYGQGPSLLDAYCAAKGE